MCLVKKSLILIMTNNANCIKKYLYTILLDRVIIYFINGINSNK